MELEKEISLYAEKMVGGYIKDYFPCVDGFIRKHCKQSEAFSITEETSLSIQGTVDIKTIESTTNDLSNASVSPKLQKILEFCERQFSGYSLKLVLKKFMGIFMKYYNEIYKYLKSNHGELVNGMLQPHNMMKEIKNAFAKYNV